MSRAEESWVTLLAWVINPDRAVWENSAKPFLPKLTRRA